MSDPHDSHHVNLAAANELDDQSERAKAILERLAKDFAAADLDRPPHERDLVERRHVIQAAELLFGSVVAQSSGEKRAQVFISHSTRNKSFVRKLHDDLKRKGVRCFVADLSIRTASLWVEELWNALAACRVVAIVITPQSLTSQWCTAESGAAIALKKTVVPILRGVAPDELPGHLKQYQAITVNSTTQRSRLIQLLVDLSLPPNDVRDK